MRNWINAEWQHDLTLRDLLTYTIITTIGCMLTGIGQAFV